MKAVVAGAVAVLVSLGLVLGLVVVGGLATSSAVVAVGPMTGGLCLTTGPVAAVSPIQATNARTVVAVADAAGGQEAALIAVMTALTESGLRVLGNSSVSTGSIPTQGSGSNYDSLGLFQQRAGWGSVAERMDPTASTGLFVVRLLADPGWQTKDPWVAAQDVQRSAWTGVPSLVNGGSAVYGGNYQANLAEATGIVSAVEGDASALACGQLPGAVGAGPPSGHGLPVGYMIPANADAAEVQAVSFALAQLGKPYVWGAAGPNAYDCSGLTMAAWGSAGVKLVHYTGDQFGEGNPVVSVESMVAGDLILTPGSDGTLAAPGHVGMYIGDGLVLDAADTQLGVIVQTYSGFVAGGLSGIRHVG